MRIQRNHSNLSFRRRSQKGGCFTILVVVGVLVGTGVLARDWIRQWVLVWWQNPGINITLRDAQMAFARGDFELTEQYSKMLLEATNEDHGALVLLTRTLIYQSYTDIHRERERFRALEYTTVTTVEARRGRSLVHPLEISSPGNTVDENVRSGKRTVE